MLIHRHGSPVPPARVAILGARGFIARALASRLARRGVPTLPISSARIDLASPAAGRSLAALLDPADVVVMTAALTPDKGQDAGTLMRNLAMGEAVAQAIAARPGAQLVYLSSDAVYDWRQPLISEQVAPSPTSLYSSMHLTREQVLTAAAAAARVPCCLLRPCAVYGPGDTHQGYGPNRFVRTALADGVIELFGEGEEQRDHVYIEDVAAAIEAAILHRSEGTLNVVSGRSVSFAEVARSVAALAARPVAIRHRDRRGPVTHRHFDPTALWRAFPDFRPTDLAAGLRLAVSAP